MKSRQHAWTIAAAGFLSTGVLASGGSIYLAKAAEPPLAAATAAPTRLADPLPEPQTVPSNPDKEAYFGQTHSHTSWSIDAYLIGNHITGPEEAYKYSLGQPVKHPSGHDVQIKGRPLDFHGVTDHSEYAGVIALANDPTSPFSKLPIAQKLVVKTTDDFNRVFKWIAGSVKDPIKELMDPKVAGTIWKQNIAIADKYNQPGKFTTFVAYEWTSAPENQNMHRNVFFKDSKNVPDLPFTALNSYHPEDLWAWMDSQRKGGTQVLAISHNANLSNGLMFPVEVDMRGRPIDAAWAESRRRNEILTEIHQIKGTSETHPNLSPSDEFANYEIMNFLIGLDNSKSKLNGSYIREAYQNGLAMQEKRGYNPYKMGVVGASDSHNTVVAYSQSNNFGAHGMTDNTPDIRLANRVDSGMAILQTSVSGLGGVWAESNTREALFNAMQRKEVFGTSGVRIKVRLFGGWDFGREHLIRRDWVKNAYEKGVPMGGDLPAAKAKEPTFIVWAVKDPEDANLDRIQIIKGWTKQGQTFEKIYDVAWSEGRKPDPKTGRVPAVGSTVDISKAAYTNTIGAVELKAEWKDPEFDPAVHAFYYARVLQIPTPRWSTYDAAKLKVAPPKEVASTVQERVWTTPIWYSPTGQKPAGEPAGLTVERLRQQGVTALDEAQLKQIVTGRTVAVRNTVTAQRFEVPYEIVNGRIRTTVEKQPLELTVYKVGSKLIGARDGEFGYANYVISAALPVARAGNNLMREAVSRGPRVSAHEGAKR
jgi:Protein of unknown function (DUF3604)